MAIVQVRSTNPSFTFLIKKNPNTGMQIRQIRKGLAYGWYTDDAIYNVYFKDADNEISFKESQEESFEYLNVSRYNTPLFPLSAINEFFSTPLKAQHERDKEGYEHTFFINMVHVEMVRYVEFFAKYLPEYRFELEHRAHKSYALSITTNRSLYHLLHVVSVLCLFLSMFGNEYIDISDDILAKYIRSINMIDAPFYIRSLFVRNFLSGKDRFRKYKAEIEQTTRYAIDFDYGRTGLQRRNFIGSHLKYDKSILDVGCGEGFYAIPFAAKLQEANYYAIDIDEELLRTVERKAADKDIDNIAAFSSVDRFLETYNGEQVDIILTEVIEHMSLEEAAALLRQLLDNIDYDRFIVTTPNADFNIYYELDGFRHDDHKWELGEAAFRSWLSEVLEERRAILDVEYWQVGDGVNDIRTTQGLIIRRKGA
jgi:small RNA 2'-O-methyltransferase